MITETKLRKITNKQTNSRISVVVLSVAIVVVVILIKYKASRYNEFHVLSLTQVSGGNCVYHFELVLNQPNKSQTILFAMH